MSNLSGLLAALAAEGVEFILVGALALVAQGAPITTFDADILHRRTPENVDRLLAFLLRHEARHRGQPSGRILPPTRDALLTHGHSLLATSLGQLDVLGSVEGGKTYDDLLPDSEIISIDGHELRVLSLAALAQLKRASTRAKDKLTLLIVDEMLKDRV